MEHRAGATDPRPAAVRAARPLRVFFAGGSGDVIGTYEQWARGREDDSIVSRAYSSQFYSACKKFGAAAYVVAAYHQRRSVDDGRFILRHRPIPGKRSGTIGYYLGQALYAVNLMARAIAFRADVMVVSTGMEYFLLSPLRCFGIEIVPSLHCALWPAGFPPSGLGSRVTRRLNGWFWKRIAAATICVSPTCENQVRELAPNPRGRLHQVRAQYRRGALDALPDPPPPDATPFRVMFAGRMERNKGVFDILEVADRLEQKQPGRYRWEVYGRGNAFDSLRAEVERRGLADVFQLKGQTDQAGMAAAYGRSHVVVVPTTSNFAEGLNKVAVESILTGRPLVTSRMSNALDVLGDAVVEVPPDDVDGYEQALLRLARDTAFYQRKREACRTAQEQFYDPRNAWGRALEQILHDTAVRKGLAVPPMEMGSE